LNQLDQQNGQQKILLNSQLVVNLFTGLLQPTSTGLKILIITQEHGKLMETSKVSMTMMVVQTVLSKLLLNVIQLAKPKDMQQQD